ncbi:MAG: sensor histidine kinase [Rugosibacter sp.]|nr:MAG: sensor histidine kinase [Rugosibacter sp.]
MPSITGNLVTSGLPDFRQGALWLRTLLVVNLVMVLSVLAANRDWAHLFIEFIEIAALLEPVLLVNLVVFSLISDWITPLPRRTGWAMFLLLSLLVTAAVHGFFVAMQWTQIGLGRTAMWSVVVTYLLLVWFDLVVRAQSPALAEARLMALTARIRPHFLFNTLNAVLGVMRSEPKRAESALEELSDLFRVLMRENRTLVPLSEEIAVARQYLNLERLRLGDRIQVQWDMASCPPDPLVPPLMLQPLLENAVYHGIEPSTQPGDILIRCEQVNNRVRLELSNNLATDNRHAQGNQMALANIRERLLLFFQLEAVMTTGIHEGRFHVLIEFPYRRHVAS